MKVILSDLRKLLFCAFKKKKSLNQSFKIQTLKYDATITGIYQLSATPHR